MTREELGNNISAYIASATMGATNIEITSAIMKDVDAYHARSSERTDEGVDYKALAIELSDALLTVRPLGGSELLIKRGDRYYADPAYLKLTIERDRDRQHEWIKEAVRAKKDCAKAEARLAEAVKALDPFEDYPDWAERKNNEMTGMRITYRQLRAAHAALRIVVSGSTEGGK